MEGYLKILTASRNLNFSDTTDEESTCIRYRARSFSSALRNFASAADLGRYKKAKTLNSTLALPSMMNR